jgi:HPt (histidine-containing phosphotransfer) domain-containing protein
LSEINQLAMMDEKTLQRLVQETSEEMVERMIAVFVKEVQRRFNAMREGLITVDLDSIETEAHTLKSNAATFGALKLAELAKIIESACKRMDETRVRSIFPETEQVLLETLVLYKTRYKISDF